MALSEESKALLQAQVKLWNQTFSFMKSVALAVALDLRIADAIHHHGAAATLPQILAGIGISPCKLGGLRRLMRVLTVAGTFTTIQPPEKLIRRARRACLQAFDSLLPPHDERRRRRDLDELLVPYAKPRAQPFP